MAQRTKIDTKELLKLVKDGVEQAEIMAKLGIKTTTQLKLAYANALIESGDAPKIKGLGKRKKKSVNMKISVNKRGSLVIPKKMVEGMGLEIGESFMVKKTSTGIQLKKVQE